MLFASAATLLFVYALILGNVIFLFDDSFWIFLNYSTKFGFVGLIETISC